MIVDIELFESLSIGSNKKIKVSCDYCFIEYETTPKKRNIANKIVDKDCCGKCKVKKREEISLAKYGVKNPFQRKDVKNKIKKTCLEKYGYESAAKSDLIKTKTKETCLAKYGVENHSQLDSVKEKYKSTCLEKYGVENASSVDEFKQKRKQTNLSRYGNEYYVASKECQDKAKEKYGVNNVFVLDWVKNKAKHTSLYKYGTEHPMQNKSVSKRASETNLQNKKNSGKINLYKNKTVSKWAEEIGFSRSRFNTLVKENGWDIAVDMTPCISSLESIIKDLLNKNNIQFKTQVKIGNYFADFVIDNIVIECDGLYWHSEVHKKDSYHVEKRQTYIDNGYKPLFFRQDEIVNKKDIVESVILNKLGLCNRIFARKCEIRECEKKDAKNFFNTNHLMGNGSGESFALCYNNEIVSCLQIRRKKEFYEISRFCNKIGFSVVGGFSRLIKNRPKLFTFIDLRYGDGEYLIDFGFAKRKTYSSFKWTNGSQCFHRMKYPSNTGYNHKMYKIWDCGQLRYEQV